MPQKRQYSITDFSRGMASNPDPADIEANAAILVRNGDLSQFPGCLSKDTGVSRYDFGGALPNGSLPENEEIMSVGCFTYNKVWSGSDKVNKKYEVVVFQFRGEHDFDWYETQREVGMENWEELVKYFCGYVYDSINGWTAEYSQPEFEGAWGVSNDHDLPVRWNAHNGVLRAAMGSHILLADQQQPNHPMENKSDSFPLQWRYVNRFPADSAIDEVNGYFKMYDNRLSYNGNCLAEYAGVVRGVGLPDYTPPAMVLLQSGGLIPNTWKLWNGMGYTSATIKYVLVPIYDGHQIGAQKAEAVLCNKIQGTGAEERYHTWGTKIQITITDFADINFPKRLTGFLLCRSHIEYGLIEESANITSTIMPPYDIIAHIDIKDGVENLYSDNGKLTSLTTAMGVFKIKVEYDDLLAIEADNLKNLTVKFTDDNGLVKEFPIETTNLNQGYLYIYYLSDGTLGYVTVGKYYAITINSRWTHSVNNTVLTFFDMNHAAGFAPFWLDPNKVLADQPKADCNYGAIEIFKERTFFTDIAFDDEKRREMLRFSFPTNHTFAGLDLAPNYLIPPIGHDDKIVGVRNHLDFLLVCTNRGFFKYLMTESGVDAIAELIWDSGLASIDAYQEVDGISYFMGKRGGKTWAYVWNPSGQPKPLAHIRSTIEGFLANGAQVDDIRVVPLLGENNVLFSFPVIT